MYFNKNTKKLNNKVYIIKKQNSIKNKKKINFMVRLIY